MGHYSEGNYLKEKKKKKKREISHVGSSLGNFFIPRQTTASSKRMFLHFSFAPSITSGQKSKCALASFRKNISSYLRGLGENRKKKMGLGK
jgi:hypothetical protein